VKGNAEAPSPLSVAAKAAAELPARARVVHPGIWIHVRGRQVRLRGLRAAPTGLLLWLAILGPGVITGAAGDDAGGIATYSQAGAQFGYSLLWVLLMTTVSLIVVQEMSARLGVASGRGLLDLIRERFGIGWAIFAELVVLAANGSMIVTEFAAIGASAELLGVSRVLVIPLAALALGYLVVAGSYGWVEKVFLVMALTFLTYPVAAVLAHPDWGQALRGTLVPTVSTDPAFLLMFVALAGATMTPYQQLFQQSAIVEKGVARKHFGRERVDTIVGMIFSNLIGAFVVIACAATLHAVGTTDISTASDAAQALRPVAGDAAQALFAIGLLGAALLAGSVVPLATAYSVTEAFGFPKGVDLDFRRAPIFLGVFVALLAGGALLALIPNVPVIQLLVAIQVLNGILLPIFLLALLLLSNDRRVAGDMRNGLLANVLGWATFAVITTSVLVLLGSQALSALGISLPGGS